LYIEDDREIGSWVSEDLQQRGYEVRWLTTGEGADKELPHCDLVILDVMLPGLDGFTVGQRLKRAAPGTPILMLSARTDVDDKLTGLKFADDYVTKPFHADELAARVEVLLRRGLRGGDSAVLGHIRVSFSDNTVIDDRTGEEVALTGKQHAVFMYFLRHPNQILMKEQIYEAVWGEPYLEGDKALMVLIRRLREKIERDPAAPEIIETIRGLGYRVKR
jgi:DNA-binding response OmpR family regulator